MKKFAKCNLTVALTLVQVNPLPLSERSSVRPHYFEYAQFELCLAKICGLLGSVRTPPPRPVCLWHSARLATVKLPRPLHFTH